MEHERYHQAKVAPLNNKGNGNSYVNILIEYSYSSYTFLLLGTYRAICLKLNLRLGFLPLLSPRPFFQMCVRQAGS